MDPDPEPVLDPLRIRLWPRRRGPSQRRVEGAVTLPEDQPVLDPLVKLAVSDEFQIDMNGLRPGTPPRHPARPGGGRLPAGRAVLQARSSGGVGCRSTRERSDGRKSLVSDDVTLPAWAGHVGGCGTPSYGRW